MRYDTLGNVWQSTAKLNIIQVYQPMINHTKKEVKRFYDMLGEVKKQCKSNEVNNIVDLNTKLGGGWGM